MARRKKEEAVVIVQPQETEHSPSRLELLRRAPLYRAKLDEQSLISLSEQMENYFEMKSLEGKPPTIVGLANYLGVHKNTMKNYASRNPGFKKLYAKASQICEEHLVEGTLTGKFNAAGSIFVLKNMFEGYVDKKEVETSAVFINADSMEAFKKRKKASQEEAEEITVVEVKALPSEGNGRVE